jgi:lipopolysaccharide assembly protein A
MRLIKSLIALMFIALGVVFGALNRQTVHVDLWHAEYDVSLGLTLIVVLLGGALLGGLVVTAGVVWPLRRQMRRSTGNAGSGPEPALPVPGDSP